MKYISCLLLAIAFLTSTTQACDPAKPCTKPTDTTASKKAPVKVASPVAPTSKKPVAKKEDRKAEDDIVTPLSWKPTLLY